MRFSGRRHIGGELRRGLGNRAIGAILGKRKEKGGVSGWLFFPRPSHHNAIFRLAQC